MGATRQSRQSDGDLLRQRLVAVYLSENTVHHRRTKHIELDIHFVRERVALDQFRIL